MSWAPTKLKTSHHEMIRMAFTGMPYVEIAERVGMSEIAVGLVLRSPLAQAELRRMQEEATKLITNLPLRVALNDRLGMAADDAVAVNHSLMLDDSVPAHTRARIASHFMDRMVFDKNAEDTREDSYRSILRQLTDIKQTLGGSSMLLPPVNGKSNGAPHEAPEAKDASSDDPS